MNNDEQQPAMEPVLETEPWDPWQEAEQDQERWPRAVHYLFWIICLGLCSVDSYFQFQEISSIIRPLWLLLATVALTTVSSATFLFGMGLLVVRRTRGMNFPLYEGEYLLLAAGVHYASYIVLHILPTIFIGRQASFLSGEPHQAVAIVVPTLSALAMMLAWRRAGRAWRIFIIMYSAMILLLCFGNLRIAASLQFLSTPLDGLTGLYLIGLAFMDITKKRQLPWTHWLGIAAYLWQESASGGFQLYHSTLHLFQSLWPF